MNNLKTVFKVLRLFCSRKYVDLIDISNSYTKVSSNYNNSFLNEMHKYNEEMLDKLICEYKAVKVTNYNNISSKENIEFNVDRNINDTTNNNSNSNTIGNSVRVLDLACGTGFNSSYINERVNNCSFSLVDISKGMLSEAKKKSKFKSEFIEKDMLSYLKSCDDNSFDIVVCAWAIKYQNPHKIIKEISRVLKKSGLVAVIVNLKSTLPEVRKIYPKIIKKHCNEIDKIMLELPNPISENSFNKWFVSKEFNKVYSKSGSHKFIFKSTDKLVQWVTSTGALAGFDIMVNMEDENVVKTMAELFKENHISSITHKFVWGVYKNEK